MQEKISVSLIVLVILFFYQFPNLFAYLKTPPNKFYTGTSYLYDPWDVNVYIASINWSQKFGLNFQNSYTTIPHKPILFYPLYIFTGTILKSPSPLYLYYALTFFATLFFVLITYRIAKIFLTKYNFALVAVLLTSFGGGLGWYLTYLGFDSPDITLTPFTLANTFQKPHELIALSFYFIALTLFFLGVNNKKEKFILFSILSFAIVIPFYPYYILSYLIIAFLYLLTKWKAQRKVKIFLYFLVATIITTPLSVIYGKYLISSNIFEGVTSPLLSKPNLIEIVSGYGILVIFVILQLFKHHNSDKVTFLLIWFITSISLILIPYGFSRYFLRGLFFPLVLIALIYLENIPKKLMKYRSLVFFTFAILLSINSFVIFKARIEAIKDGSGRFIYINSEEKEAIDFLKNNTSPGSGVLTNYILGNLIPVFTYNRVYYGHNTQTPNTSEKIANLTKFYSNEFSDEEAKEFLIENKISYVVWGKDEKQTTIDAGFRELKYKFLKKVFSNTKVDILLTHEI